MNIYVYIIDVFLYFDKYLGIVINNYGFEIYLILFFIIFLEIGLVVILFLLGDLLIFVVVIFVVLGVLNIYILVGVLMVVVILGDIVNYEIGRYLGEKLLKSEWLIKKEYIEIINKFYEKYGGKIIIFVRFVLIVCILVFFVVGIGKMSYKYFIFFNVLGGIFWVLVVFICGYFFGNILVVKENFIIVVIGIIVIFIFLGIIGFVKSKINKYNEVV